MLRFLPSTHHLIMNESNGCMGSVAVHRIQHKLHLLDPDIFPLLGDHGIPDVTNVSTNGEELSKTLNRDFSVCKSTTVSTFHLRPFKLLDRLVYTVFVSYSFI